jgi:iron complex outermembrane receptor protein
MFKRLLFLLSLSVTAVSGQHTVSGLITDKHDDKLLLQHVSVSIPEFNRFDFSKEGGTYILRNVGVGIATLHFYLPGYAPLSIAINTADSATVVNIQLEKSALQFSAPSLTAARLNTLQPLPFSSLQVASDEWRRNGAVHPMAALSVLPGVDRITLGNAIQRPVIRGSSGNSVLAYQYGLRMETSSWNPYQDLELNDLSAGTSEIVKGPMTLLYGPNASGGVLIFGEQLPPALGSVVGNVSLGYSTNTAGVESAVGVNGAAKSGWFYAFDAGVKNHTSYVQGDTGVVEKNSEDKDFAINSKYNSTAVKAMTGLSKSWGNSRLTFSYFRQQLGLVEPRPTGYFEPGTITRDQREREFFSPYVDVTTNKVAWQNVLLLGNGQLQANVGVQQSSRAEIDTLKEKYTDLRVSTISYDVHYASDLRSKAGFTAGVQGAIEKNSNEGKVFYQPNGDQSDIGVYGIGRYTVRKLQLTGGARYDLRRLSIQQVCELSAGFNPDSVNIDRCPVDRNFNGLSVSAGAVWQINERFNVRLNGASGFSPMNSYQLSAFSRTMGMNRFIVGDAALNAEKNLQVDLGADYHTTSFFVNGSLFRNAVKDFTYASKSDSDIVIVTDTLPVYGYRQEDAVLQGGDISFTLRPQSVRWIDFGVRYAWVRAEFTGKVKGNVPWQPADKLSAAVTLRKEKMGTLYNSFLQLSATNYAAQNRTASFEQSTEGYTLFDLNAGGSMRWADQVFDITLSATNLLNTGYINPLSVYRDRNIREMGRNIVIRLRFPIGVSSPDREKKKAEREAARAIKETAR